jgi:flagellar protein FliS
MTTFASPQARAAADKYLETKVLSASPAELRLMLLDGAIKFCRQGREGLASKNYEQMYNGFTRTRAILVELMNTMKPEPDRELYDRLHSLYMFMITHLLEASLEKDVSKADKVIDLIQYDRETWALLMQKNASEQRGTGAAAGEISVQG